MDILCLKLYVFYLSLYNRRAGTALVPKIQAHIAQTKYRRKKNRHRIKQCLPVSRKTVPRPGSFPPWRNPAAGGRFSSFPP